jgi:hypothetical protein
VNKAENNLLYAVKYAVLILTVWLLIVLEQGAFFRVVFFQKLRLSLVICAVLGTVSPKFASLITAGVCGLLCDVFSMCLPYYSLFYLYISYGCVWCESFFVSLKNKTVFLVCFFVWLVVGIGMKIFEMLTFGELFFSFRWCFDIFLSAFLNSALSPVVYMVLKRMKF